MDSGISRPSRICVFHDILQSKSGRYIVDFEMRRYQIKCHLPEIEDEDSQVYCRTLWSGRTSDYFGAFPVPSLYSKRVHCTAYDHSERCVLAGNRSLRGNAGGLLSNLKSDISIPEQNQGEQLEYDRMYGIDNTPWLSLFLNRTASSRLHELSLFARNKGERQCS